MYRLPVSWLLSESFIYFFFQAEDGIRDIGVTGVQTCALPIYQMIGYQLDYNLTLGRMSEVAQRGSQAIEERAEGIKRYRSEERRVGKECRSWWSPCH